MAPIAAARAYSVRRRGVDGAAAGGLSRAGSASAGWGRRTHSGRYLGRADQNHNVNVERQDVTDKDRDEGDYLARMSTISPRSSTRITTARPTTGFSLRPLQGRRRQAQSPRAQGWETARRDHCYQRGAPQANRQEHHHPDLRAVARGADLSGARRHADNGRTHHGCLHDAHDDHEFNNHEPDNYEFDEPPFDHLVDEHDFFECDVVDQHVVDQHVVDQHVVDQHVVDQDIVDRHIVDRHVVDEHLVHYNHHRPVLSVRAAVGITRHRGRRVRQPGWCGRRRERLTSTSPIRTTTASSGSL
jgi:hypothetical protein